MKRYEKRIVIMSMISALVGLGLVIGVIIGLSVPKKYTHSEEYTQLSEQIQSMQTSLEYQVSEICGNEIYNLTNK